MINSPMAGYSEKIVEMQSEVSVDDIEAMGKLIFGVYNLFCSYEILKEGD